MELKLTQTPFSSHDNILYDFIKKSLVDSNIYDTSKIAYPFSNKSKKYKLKLTGCSVAVKILFNDQDYINFGGGSDYEFYIAPQLGPNEIKVVDPNNFEIKNGIKTYKTLYTSFNFNTYNIHLFLAFIAFKFKQIWNKLYQAQADTYYADDKIKDLDGNFITPEYQYTRAVATLLNTKRYSKLTNSQYYTFLHSVFDINKNAGTLRSFYDIQNALPTYISRVDAIPVEDYLVQRKSLNKKVFRDPDDNTKLKIYPNFVSTGNDTSGVLPYYNQSPDSTASFVSFVYVDGDVYSDTTNWGALKIKYSNDAEFYKSEYVYDDIFLSVDIYNDSDGSITGFENSKYVALRKPIIGDILNTTTSGEVKVDLSTRLITDPDYNIVDLGSKYQNEITSVDIQYKTYTVPVLLAKITKDSTTGEIQNISMSGHPVDNNLGVGDEKYLSYKQNNYGYVVIIIRAIQKIDNELKEIINNLIRDLLPLHIGYYLHFSLVVPNIWNYWGDTQITFRDFDSTGQFFNVTFADLK